MNDVEVQSVQSKFLYTDPIINRLEGNVSNKSTTIKEPWHGKNYIYVSSM